MCLVDGDFGQRSGVAPPKLVLEFSWGHVGHGDRSSNGRGAYFRCCTAWACDGYVVNRGSDVGIIKMVEEWFKDRANMAFFIASEALKFFML